MNEQAHENIIAELRADIERLRAANRVLKDERSRLLNELRAIQEFVNAVVVKAA